MTKQKVPYVGICPFSQERTTNSIGALVALHEQQLYIPVQKLRENTHLISVSCSANQN